MKKSLLLSFLLVIVCNASAQHVGIVRQNFYSTYFDNTLNTTIEVFDSSTIRLGSVNPITGVVSNLNTSEYTLAINLNGATINPYSNRYYISSGFRLLTFNMNSGNIVNNVPITGPFTSASFQNYRFNPSDTTIYGMVPNNFYSTYFDSTIMSNIEVLDSIQIRFASIDPTTGVYSLIGNTSFDNLYTLAGNSIDPYQMLYYYSAVDTLIGIDLYTGAQYSAVPIQVPPTAIFENIAYSCADTTIYGITRQNYTSTYYDTLLMMDLEQIDSTTFRLSKINPETGEVTYISPNNIGAGGNLTGGAFIDPNSMTFFFSNGNYIVGASLITGLITSSVLKTYETGAVAFDMMRSSMNCYGASKVRLDTSAGIDGVDEQTNGVELYPNPANNELTIALEGEIDAVEIMQLNGALALKGFEKHLDITSLPQGMYLVKILSENGQVFIERLVKQ
jgi:hypothetical protein